MDIIGFLSSLRNFLGKYIPAINPTIKEAKEMLIAIQMSIWNQFCFIQMMNLGKKISA